MQGSQQHFHKKIQDYRTGLICRTNTGFPPTKYGNIQCIRDANSKTLLVRSHRTKGRKQLVKMVIHLEVSVTRGRAARTWSHAEDMVASDNRWFAQQEHSTWTCFGLWTHSPTHFGNLHIHLSHQRSLCGLIVSVILAKPVFEIKVFGHI